MEGDPTSLESELGTHQTALEDQLRQLACIAERLPSLRAEFNQGQAPAAGELVGAVAKVVEIG